MKGVGPRRAAELERAGLRTADDLLHRFPIRFEDRSRLRRSTDLRPGEAAAVCGEVVSVGLRRTRRRGFTLFEMLLRDDAGMFRVVWMNQPFLQDVFSPGQRVALYGKVEWRDPGGLRLTNPQYELTGREGDDDDGMPTGRIVPVYERIGSLTNDRSGAMDFSIEGPVTSASATSAGRRRRSVSQNRVSVQSPTSSPKEHCT